MYALIHRFAFLEKWATNWTNNGDHIAHVSVLNVYLIALTVRNEWRVIKKIDTESKNRKWKIVGNLPSE